MRQFENICEFLSAGGSMYTDAFQECRELIESEITIDSEVEIVLVIKFLTDLIPVLSDTLSVKRRRAMSLLNMLVNYLHSVNFKLHHDASNRGRNLNNDETSIDDFQADRTENSSLSSVNLLPEYESTRDTNTTDVGEISSTVQRDSDLRMSLVNDVLLPISCLLNDWHLISTGCLNVLYYFLLLVNFEESKYQQSIYMDLAIPMRPLLAVVHNIRHDEFEFDRTNTNNPFDAGIMVFKTWAGLENLELPARLIGKSFDQCNITTAIFLKLISKVYPSPFIVGIRLRYANLLSFCLCHSSLEISTLLNHQLVNMVSILPQRESDVEILYVYVRMLEFMSSAVPECFQYSNDDGYPSFDQWNIFSVLNSDRGEDSFDMSTEDKKISAADQPGKKSISKDSVPPLLVPREQVRHDILIAKLVTLSIIPVKVRCTSNNASIQPGQLLTATTKLICNYWGHRLLPLVLDALANSIIACIDGEDGEIFSGLIADIEFIITYVGYSIDDKNILRTAVVPFVELFVLFNACGNRRDQEMSKFLKKVGQIGLLSYVRDLNTFDNRPAAILELAGGSCENSSVGFLRQFTQAFASFVGNGSKWLNTISVHHPHMLACINVAELLSNSGFVPAFCALVDLVPLFVANLEGHLKEVEVLFNTESVMDAAASKYLVAVSEVLEQFYVYGVRSPLLQDIDGDLEAIDYAGKLNPILRSILAVSEHAAACFSGSKPELVAKILGQVEVIMLLIQEKRSIESQENVRTNFEELLSLFKVKYTDSLPRECAGTGSGILTIEQLQSLFIWRCNNCGRFPRNNCSETAVTDVYQSLISKCELSNLSEIFPAGTCSTLLQLGLDHLLGRFEPVAALAAMPIDSAIKFGLLVADKGLLTIDDLISSDLVRIQLAIELANRLPDQLITERSAFSSFSCLAKYSIIRMIRCEQLTDEESLFITAWMYMIAPIDGLPLLPIIKFHACNDVPSIEAARELFDIRSTFRKVGRTNVLFDTSSLTLELMQTLEKSPAEAFRLIQAFSDISSDTDAIFVGYALWSLQANAIDHEALLYECCRLKDMNHSSRLCRSYLSDIYMKLVQRKYCE